jgi:hypothetical protein
MCIEEQNQSFGNALLHYDHQSRSAQNVHSNNGIAKYLYNKAQPRDLYDLLLPYADLGVGL